MRDPCMRHIQADASYFHSLTTSRDQHGRIDSGSCSSPTTWYCFRVSVHRSQEARHDKLCKYISVWSDRLRGIIYCSFQKNCHIWSLLAGSSTESPGSKTWCTGLLRLVSFGLSERQDSTSSRQVREIDQVTQCPHENSRLRFFQK